MPANGELILSRLIVISFLSLFLSPFSSSSESPFFIFLASIQKIIQKK